MTYILRVLQELSPPKGRPNSRQKDGEYHYALPDEVCMSCSLTPRTGVELPSRPPHPPIELTRHRQSRQAVSEGFSLSVTLIKDTGKDVRTEEYYQGCKLVLRARGLKRFTGLFVAGVSAEGLWESFDVSYFRSDTDTRRGVFSTHHKTPCLFSHLTLLCCSSWGYFTRRIYRRLAF